MESKPYKLKCGCQVLKVSDIIKKADNLPSLDVSFENINEECPLAWKIFDEGLTQGVFQLEKNLGQSWSKKIGAKDIEDISTISSLIRPGCLRAMSNNKSMTAHYADRKKGKEEVSYLHPALEDILSETQGVLVYQEQAMKIATEIAGFDLKQADILRKAIGKKKADIMMKVKDDFMKGCQEKGIVNQEQAKEIFGWIQESQKYSFNKSHGVSYGKIGYWTAWAKSHYPSHFFCAWLSFAKEKQDEKEEIKNLISDSKTFDVSVMGPDLSLYHVYDIYDFSLNRGGNINFGMKNVKGVGDSQIEKFLSIINDVENSLDLPLPGWNWEQFLFYAANRLSDKLVIGMISTGALDFTGVTRKRMLFEYNMWKKLTNKEQNWVQRNCSPDGSLAYALKEMLEWQEICEHKQATKRVKVKDLDKPISRKDRVERIENVHKSLEDPAYNLKDSPEWIARTEEELLGVPVTASVLQSCDTSGADSSCREIVNGKPGNSSIAVEIIDCREYKVKNGKNKGNKMGFLSVQDESAKLENVVIFTSSYEKYKNLLKEGNTVLIVGKPSDKEGQDSFIANVIRQI